MHNLKEKPFRDVNCIGLSELMAPELFGVSSPANVIMPESDFVSSCLVLNITPAPEGLALLANADFFPPQFLLCKKLQDSASPSSFPSQGASAALLPVTVTDTE